MYQKNPYTIHQFKKDIINWTRMTCGSVGDQVYTITVKSSPMLEDLLCELYEERRATSDSENISDIDVIYNYLYNRRLFNKKTYINTTKEDIWGCYRQFSKQYCRVDWATVSEGILEKFYEWLLGEPTIF